MLNRLKYSVTFPQTGRTLSFDHVIGAGFWAITGPNESGKSMVFEVARWLLFGTKALRGKADHYKTLKASGEFIIRDNVIEIDRTARGGTMKRNGALVATGTSAINAKVIEELGFGMGVFDVACSINQGEIENLGKMLPTQRKAMIDSVLGLATLDLVAKWAGEEATLLKRQADGMRERLTPPGAPPIQPVNYIPSASTQVRLDEARIDAAEFQQLSGWLANELSKPEAPTTKVELPSENLVSLAGKRQEARERVAGLTARVNALPGQVVFSDALLDDVETAWTAFEAYDDEASWARKHPRPAEAYADLISMDVAWTDRDDWNRYEQLVADAERLRAALDAVDTVTCPECSHSFALHAEHAARLEGEHIAALQLALDMKPTAAKPDEPRLKPAEITRLQLAWEDFDEDRMVAFEALEPVAQPVLTMREVASHRAANLQVVERGELQEQLTAAQKKLDGMADYETMLIERRAYEAALVEYRTKAQAYEAWLAERQQKAQRQRELTGISAVVLQLEAETQVARDWERQIDAYEAAVEVFDRVNAEIKQLDADADEHRKVREVMAVLRGLIKQHVLPSLNVVASQLLRQMTGGQRNIIVVDDDFDVMVDNQELDTLSGSGKAVANLSLRIALGQVLTNRVMSIMMADEIDASMDDFRVEKTADVLRMLEERVSQVLLVSHKNVEAPNYIRLGDTSAADE